MGVSDCAVMQQMFFWPLIPSSCPCIHMKDVWNWRWKKNCTEFIHKKGILFNYKTLVDFGLGLVNSFSLYKS